MNNRERLEGETTGEFIARRAHEIHMEEAWVNDLAISPEERMVRSALVHGLINIEDVPGELTITDAERWFAE